MREALLSNNTEGMFATIRRMKVLRERALSRGLDWNRDLPELEELFGKDRLPQEGTRENAPAENPERFPLLPELYLKVFRDSEQGDKAAQSHAATFIAEELDSYLNFLQRRAQESEERDEQLKVFRAACNLIPDEKDCEPLMRYEAHLDRMLDRALNQLERLQRMRRGQPVLPPIKVEVST